MKWRKNELKASAGSVSVACWRAVSFLWTAERSRGGDCACGCAAPAIRWLRFRSNQPYKPPEMPAWGRGYLFQSVSHL